ncbi:MAG: hypothetical protein LBI05_09125 [Planctomycetaceae bacterium]|jgi:hypothetical protein|nr:hypothetical protein [Planctomycetaceae bacterium]
MVPQNRRHSISVLYFYPSILYFSLTMQKIQLLIVVIVGLMIAGCGPKGISTQYVEGIITLDGEPLDGALVTFYPVQADGRTAAGISNEMGVYKLTADGGLPEKGAVEGNYRVTVSKMEVRFMDNPRQTPAQENDRVSPYSVQEIITPKNYSLLDKTPLTATVNKGKNDLPFDMESGK